MESRATRERDVEHRKKQGLRHRLVVVDYRCACYYRTNEGSYRRQDLLVFQVMNPLPLGRRGRHSSLAMIVLK